MREQVMKINVRWICQKALIRKECVCWEAIKPELMKEVHCTMSEITCQICLGKQNVPCGETFHVIALTLSDILMGV